MSWYRRARVVGPVCGLLGLCAGLAIGDWTAPESTDVIVPAAEAPQTPQMSQTLPSADPSPVGPEAYIPNLQSPPPLGNRTMPETEGTG